MKRNRVHNHNNNECVASSNSTLESQNKSIDDMKQHDRKIIERAKTVMKGQQELCIYQIKKYQMEIDNFEKLIENIISQGQVDVQTLKKMSQGTINKDLETIASLERDKLEINKLIKQHRDNIEQLEDEILLLELNKKEEIEKLQREENNYNKLRLDYQYLTKLDTTILKLYDERKEYIKQPNFDALFNFDSNETIQKAKDVEETTQKYKEKISLFEIQRRILFNEYQELKGNIRVYCRVNGCNVTKEARISCNADVDSRDNIELLDRGEHIKITLSRKNATSTGIKNIEREFSFDRVYDTKTSQTSIFKDVEALVDTTVDGYDVCIFSYGQSSSGKTYTMEGLNMCLKPKNLRNSYTLTDHCGIIPRSIERLFFRISKLESSGWKYDIKCSYFEVYLDTLIDLLDSKNAAMDKVEGAKMTDNATKFTLRNIPQCKEVSVKSSSEVHNLLRNAAKKRSTSKTLLNEHSSRSHCIFMLHIKGSNSNLNAKCTGVLSLIDLAGSERINISGVQGQEKKESISINQGLSALGDCIHALSNKSNHIPWRANKLTSVLQQYMEKSKILMFVNISNEDKNIKESLNSLDFAQKVNRTEL